MISGWMIYLVILAVGGLICFRGLSLYKLVQFLICGWAGASLTWWILDQVTIEWSSAALLAAGAIVGLITGFLGFHFYKVGLYASASISAFCVVLSFFGRQVLEMGKKLIDQVGELENVFSANNLLHTFLTGTQEGGSVGILDRMLLQAGIQPALWAAELDQMMALMKRGIIWAGAAGLLCGILAVVFGDYVIIVLTAVFGGMLLNLLVELLLPVNPAVSLVMLCGFAALGIMMQLKKKRAG